MANTNSIEIVAVAGTVPQQQYDSAIINGKLRCKRASFALAAQPAADTLTLGDIPEGARIVSIVMTSSVTLGAATIAIGIAGTPAKYRAAGVFTTPDIPTPVGPPAAIKDDPALAATETLVATIAAAALPGAGQLVFDIIYAQRA